MRRLILIMSAAWLVTAPAFAQDHTDVVAQAKVAIVARGIIIASTPGTDDNPCGPWFVTNLAAWTLRAEGAGLLRKSGGVQCRGYATDVVMYPDGRIVDVLVDKGNAATPAWNAGGMVDPSRWAPPLEEGASPSPVPSSGPAAPVESLTQLLLNQQVILANQQALLAGLTRLEAKVDTLAMNTTANTAAIRSDISAFRKAAGNVVTQALKLAPGVIAGLELLKR